jgi:hypothetical protein
MVYIPTFLLGYEEHLFNGENKLALNRELLKKDWLTTDLCHEIIGLYPSVHKKDPDTGKREQAAFVAKATIIFPLGRIFASFKQLDQVAKLFIDMWAIAKVHGHGKIYCAHGVSHGKFQKLHSIINYVARQM